MSEEVIVDKLAFKFNPNVKTLLILNKLLNNNLSAALFLHNLIFKYFYFCKKNKLISIENEDGWFYSTQENFEIFLGFNSKKQQRIVNYLSEFGFIQVTRNGFLFKNFYRINFDKINTVFLQLQSELDKLDQFDYFLKFDFERESKTENIETLFNTSDIKNIKTGNIQVYNLLQEWVNLGLPIARETSKSYKQSICYLEDLLEAKNIFKGLEDKYDKFLFTKKYNYDDILEIFKLYKTKVDAGLMVKKSLRDFILVNTPSIKYSLFLKLQSSQKKVNIKKQEDTNNKNHFLKAFKDIWQEEKGITYKEDILKVAVNKYVAFWQKYDDKIVPEDNRNILVKWLFLILNEKFSEWDERHLAGDHLYNNLLIPWLKMNGYWIEGGGNSGQFM
jgi:hypothetical protein